MRVVRFLARVILALVVATAATLLVAPPSRAASLPGFSTAPRTANHGPAGPSTLVDLRAGRHADFDRVVFQLDGPLPAYSIRYVPVVRSDGSGAPLPLRGAAFLEAVVHAATHDQNGQPVLAPSRLRPDFAALRDVDVPGSFEGQTTAGIGVSYRAPFRVLELTNPARIIVDLAHPQIVDDGGLSNGPRALTVTPASGPVGTRVTVEGRGCGNLDQPVRLVFQSGGRGTVGAVDLGVFPVSEQDAFRATSVVIPARMDPLQGVGGGPTRPGTYQFTTRPPACTATFTVTSSATVSGSGAGAASGRESRPPAGSPHPDVAAPGAAPNPAAAPDALPFTGTHALPLVAVGSGLLLAGAGLVLILRRHARHTA